MNILKFVGIRLQERGGQMYQAWFDFVSADKWFFPPSELDIREHNCLGGTYGDLGFFCFSDSEEIS